MVRFEFTEETRRGLEEYIENQDHSRTATVKEDEEYEIIHVSRLEMDNYLSDLLAYLILEV